MPATVVDELYESFVGLLSVLDEAGEVSLRAVADKNLRNHSCSPPRALYMRALHFVDAVPGALREFDTDRAA